MTEADMLAAVDRIAAGMAMPAVAPEAERAKANAIIRALATEQLLSPVVPAASGGAGLSVVATARAVARIGQASGSAGLIWAMHLAQVVTVVRHGTADHLHDVLARLVERQTLIASATSEVGVGGNILKSLCVIEAAPAGGHRLTKSCTNISYTDQAGAILATGMLEQRGRPVQRLVLLEAPAFDLRVDREALFLGMRGIVNRAVTIDGSFPAAAIFPEPFAVIARTMSAASHVFWSALWSGLGAAAIGKASALLANDANASEGPHAARLSAAADRLSVMHALIRDACLDFDGGATGSAFQGAARSNRLKVACADLLGGIIDDCVLVSGFRGYVEGTQESLSEIVRDSLSARIMVSNDRLSGNNAALRKFVHDQI